MNDMTAVTIKNKFGLHAQPASQFVNIAKQFNSKIKLIKDQNEYDGKSIMSIMMAMVLEKDVIYIHAEGEDAERAEKELVHFLEQCME